LFSNCKNEAPSESNDWPVYLGDKHNTHYSGLSQIDTNNVVNLEVAWEYHTGDKRSSGRAQECNPIEIDGRLYGTTAKLKLFALDAASGNEEWVFDPFSHTPEAQRLYNTNRGVTYWTDGNKESLFYGAGHFLYNINAKTGRPVVSFGDSGRIDLRKGLSREADELSISLTSPGIIYKNLLIIGSQVSESNPAAPGDIRAYDVRTGEIKWVFHTIPHAGEMGYDSWQDKNTMEFTGGANNWTGMALDEKR